MHYSNILPALVLFGAGRVPMVHGDDADAKTNSLSKNEIVSALSLHNEKNEIVSAHPLPKGNRPSSFHDLTGKIEEWNSKEQKPGRGLAGDIRALTVETPLPSMDIGSVNTPGSAFESADGGSWTVMGSGSNIWSTADQFHYANFEKSGDVTLEMRVDSFDAAESYAKGGVMIRDTLDTDSMHYSFFVTGFSNVEPFWRECTACETKNTPNGPVLQETPLWLQIKKVGNQFSSAYRYDNDTDWTPSGQPETIVFSSPNFYVGIAVTSNVYSSDLTTATLKGSKLKIQPSPWDINFVRLTANFSLDSVDELVMDYDIGRDHDYETLLLGGEDCETNITGIAINQTAPANARKSKNVTHDSLRLGYSFDKSKISGSNIWNATSNEIELCQVVRLIIPADPANQSPKMVIVEDTRKITIDLDLSVDFEIANTTLGAATINAGNDTVNVDSYIEACKCEGASFECNSDALVPNEDLIVCIKSISPDVKIDFLDSLIVSQEEASPLPVIEGNDVKFASFTSREYVTAKNGVVVSTRVPINLFDYDSPQSSIAITGNIVLKLADSGRKLEADMGAKFDASEEASFEIEVDLQRETMLEEETFMNSAASVASSKGVIAHVMVLAWSYAMW